MKQLLLTCFSVLATVFLCGGQQTKADCKCHENKLAGTINGQQPDSSFHFSNGKTIILCGYKNPDSKPTNFSEFILSICGQDTIIDFWDATLTCELSFKKDTLLIEDIKYLPVSTNREFKMTTWAIEEIYFSKGQLRRYWTANKKMKKYTREEIEQTIKEYETAKYGLDDNKIQLAYRLFMCTISDDNKARQYFLDFKNKFGILDGAYKEEYNELTAMLGLWDKKNNSY